MGYEITIKDDDGKIVCESVPLEEDRLEIISQAAGGLQDFIKKYKESNK